MVSRSDDGDLLVSCLLMCRIVPIRGSNRQNSGDKGGLAAIEALIEHVAGGSPGYLAVDGRAARATAYTKVLPCSRSGPAPR